MRRLVPPQPGQWTHEPLLPLLLLMVALLC
jgi:hypothetical protein